MNFSFGGENGEEGNFRARSSNVRARQVTLTKHFFALCVWMSSLSQRAVVLTLAAHLPEGSDIAKRLSGLRRVKGLSVEVRRVFVLSFWRTSVATNLISLERDGEEMTAAKRVVRPVCVARRAVEVKRFITAKFTFNASGPLPDVCTLPLSFCMCVG